MDRSAGELEEGGPWLGDDEQRAWRLLVVMLTVLPAAFDRRLRRGSGLTLFAYGVLATLSEAPARALAMSDLAAVTHASLSRLSQVVTGLERDGRVVRLPLSESGRVTMVRLTAAGTCVFETAAQMHAIEVRRLVFEALDRDQVDSLARMCSAILDGLGARTLDEGPTTRRPYRRDGEGPPVGAARDPTRQVARWSPPGRSATLHGVESFAELLRRHRGARSLTQEHLAERAGLTTNAVGALERGERRHPYPHTVRSLADALELGPEERSTLVVASARRRLDDDRTARRPVALSSLLVAPAGSVIGRDDEVDALAAVLRRELRRVVTLTGPGGVGKTTLALAVADRVRAEFPGGVVVVELADVVEPDGVLPAVAAAFGVFVADQRVTPDMLAPALIGRRTLLLLDNLERVLDVAPTLTRLVSLCPDLVVLATSRAPLRVRSEHEARVGPLSHAAAVKLFRDHAAASGLVLDDDPETTATVEAVCSRADGLPLAIELAAAAAAVIGPTALRSRLGALSATAPRDLPARQRSLTATLAWSHELLTAPARSLLARLSVCVGGFSLNTVEEIGDGEPDAVLTSLIELLEHSLVTRVADVEGTERFRLLEPIREDAADRLDPAEREQARSGLARAMLDTARALAEDLFGPGQPVALRLLHAERCNLQEAYDHLLRGDRHDDAADLLAAVWMYFTVRARARDGTVWAARLRGTPMSDGNRIRWLIVSAALATSVGDFLEARRLAEDALAVAESRGDDEGAAFAAAVAAWNATFGRDQAGARHLVARARVHGAAAGPLHVQHQLLVATSWLAMTDGALEAADAQLREGEVLMRRLGPFERGILRFHHSSVADRRGKHGEAAALLGEAVLLFLAVESNHMVAFAVPEVAAVAVRLGDLETATRLFGAASRYIAELDVDAAFRRRYQRSRSDLAHARAGLGEAAFTAAWDAGRNFTPDDLAALARRFTGNGDVGRWAVTPSQEQGDDVDLDQDLRVEQRGDADEGLRGRR